MSELLPSVEAEQIRRSLLGYLTTTFALADVEARGALTSFLDHPVDGIFRGPYVRVRLPFRPAEADRPSALEWDSGQMPYGHQAAAFERLSSANLGEAKPHPLPTLVTTGTGSGKTEAFLYPILDHVLRAKRNGQDGVKALILYPMNALANDQARRLTELITTREELRGIRAAIYTGQADAERSHVTPDGLITNRAAIRGEAPDILLTNYKMLDQLLLRGDDQTIWQQSASSLQYLVLDEFHTYDGAQGTDVAMLLRRLHLTLERYAGGPVQVTPVATSATLGDQGDPSAMIDFARTVFGVEFDESSVVTETRMSCDEWSHEAVEWARMGDFVPLPVDNALIVSIGELEDPDPEELTRHVFAALYRRGDSAMRPELVDSRFAARLAAAHPFIRALAEAATDAVRIDDLADRILPAGLAVNETYEERAERRRTFMVTVLAVLSHIRARQGRGALSIDLHLWLRALTRIDRVADPIARFRWSDDGQMLGAEASDLDSAPAYPAVYCRHCGRSGWGVQLAPVGTYLDHDDVDIRGNHLHRERGFRALIHAPNEARRAADEPVEGLRWFHVRDRIILDAPADDDTVVLPVLVLTANDVEDRSKDDDCPSCGRADGIRFIGSAVATMLSVAVTTLFGEPALDTAEKKALVFTDSVQDAAHRAGFVQSRSHVFSLRNAVRRAVGTRPANLSKLVELLLQDAGDDRDVRYRLLAPEIVDHDNFRDFWEAESARDVDPAVEERVRQRLLFDLVMEFGLQSRVGRTLELTGSLAAEVSAGTPAKLEAIGRSVLTGFSKATTLDEDAPEEVPADAVVRWVRGVLERLRDRGAIDHEWFRKYVENDGKRWYVWGGRPRGVGMPAFPDGRDAPGFARIGAPTAAGGPGQKSHLDQASSSQSWYASWARDVLDVSPAAGAHLTRSLFAQLDADGVVSSIGIGAGAATVYRLAPSSVTVHPVDLADLEGGRHLLVCDVCQNPVPGTLAVIDQLADGPCTSARCPGALRRARGGQNYYRALYDEGDMRRVVAREHTSLLDDETRLAYEDGFKSSDTEPDSPNVLVATPTLEMGIDIGDLSTVMLAGLPRTVASYLQRVGRAGRLTGNALSLAFVTGRGEQLPKLGEPLSVINGAVRAPATYLNAEEILRRQYVASLVDRRSADLTDAPRNARDVLSSTEAGSFLGDLVADAESHHRERLGAFLGAFEGDDVSAEARDGLRRWVTPGEEPGSSRFATAARDAVQRWTAQVDEVRFRKNAVADALDELRRAAEHPTAGDEERREYRTARASYAMATKQLAELRSEHWVAALERFGLLPNYSLIDDSVRLDVALSWIDPDSLEYRDKAITYERGAGIAISELAPGAVFYAQGIEITVDAVDLGSGGEAVRTWSFCPACGFGYDHGAVEQTHGTCPRCGASGIADTAQQLRVVELEQVSAEVRRDEASIGDRRDERQRERFVMQVAADVDPAGVTDAWYVEGDGFGVTYVRDLTVRWLNLGKVGPAGENRLIASEERTAPLFRVCAVCGKLDAEANVNSRREHKPWCPNRDSRDEQAIPISLSRTLTTQGILLRLPPRITIGDTLAMPSLAAAILRGLREVIGGDPDHLRIVETVQPTLSDGTENVPALLVHDAVPGGTGYLAELANVERIRELLEIAWATVRDCPCRTEGRASCHRCLLPYAPGGSADRVSRASAEHSLAVLLGVADGEPTEWDVTREDPGVVVGEPVIESLFREVFMARAKKLGAGVKEIPGDHGNKVQVTFAGSRRIWMLQPQLMLGHTQPDFVLEQFGGGAKPIAIYTDGRAFHASVAHNRIADDAQKRSVLRDQGYLVLAFTWDDLVRARDEKVEPATPWFDAAKATAFSGQYGLSLASLDHVTANPMTWLMGWMQDPDKAAKRWEAVAEALPMLVRLPSSVLVDAAGLSLDELAVAALVDGQPTGTDPTTWQLRHDRAVLTARHIGQGKTEASVVLDDRVAALAGPSFADDWRFWLRLSNLLGARVDGPSIAMAALSDILSAADAGTPGPADLTMTPDIAVEWQGLVDLATPEEQVLLHALHAVEGMPVPEMGLELGDGIPVSFAWIEPKIVVLLHPAGGDRDELESDGWIVVEPDATSVAAALGVS
ncbi:DEAD/DEAH box helicase [Agromyces sp. NPDC055661]